MQRSAYIVAIAVLVAAGSWIAYRRVEDPMAARKAVLAGELAEIGPLSDAEMRSASTGNEELLDLIRGNPALWRELVEAQKVAPKPPDLAQLLRGVTATTNQRGMGAQLKVLIKTPQNRTGGWFGVGDQINGVGIRSISRRDVEFGLEHNGKQYTLKLPRRR
jgi:hypothetical protein